MNTTLNIEFEDDTAFEIFDGDCLVGYGSYFEEDSFALVKIRHEVIHAICDVAINGTLNQICDKLNKLYAALVECCEI